MLHNHRELCPRSTLFHRTLDSLASSCFPLAESSWLDISQFDLVAKCHQTFEDPSSRLEMVSHNHHQPVAPPPQHCSRLLELRTQRLPLVSYMLTRDRGSWRAAFRSLDRSRRHLCRSRSCHLRSCWRPQPCCKSGQVCGLHYFPDYRWPGWVGRRPAYKMCLVGPWTPMM